MKKREKGNTVIAAVVAIGLIGFLLFLLVGAYKKNGEQKEAIQGLESRLKTVSEENKKKDQEIDGLKALNDDLDLIRQKNADEKKSFQDKIAALTKKLPEASPKQCEPMDDASKTARTYLRGVVLYDAFCEFDATLCQGDVK